MKKGMIWIIVGALLLMAWFGAGAILALYLWERNSTEMASLSDYTVRFGKVSTDDDNPTFLEETAVLPLHYKDSGLRFGVEIVPSDDKPYTVYFIYHFSKPPKVVSGEGFAGKIPSTTLQTDPATYSGTSVTSNWFDPGDPTGQQSMDVFINDKLVKTFNFTVIPDS